MNRAKSVLAYNNPGMQYYSTESSAADSDKVGLFAAVFVTVMAVVCSGDPAPGADPRLAFYYVLWLLLNGGMWNKGDKILCGRFGI